MKSKKALSMALALVMLVTLFSALGTVSADAGQIKVKVRLYDLETYDAYLLGYDYVDKAESGARVDYRIPDFSKWDVGTATVTEVVGNWVFPSGSVNEGANVELSNNTSTATITYWVKDWEPKVIEPETPGTSTPESPVYPDTEAGQVALNIQIVYKDDTANLGYKYGDKEMLIVQCQSQYCSHNMNCSILLKDFHPTKLSSVEIPEGYKWIGWNKYTLDLNNMFDTFYDWTSDTTNLTSSGSTFYLVYENDNLSAGEPVLPPVDDEVENPGDVNGDGKADHVDAMAIMEFLSGNRTATEEEIAAADFNGDGKITHTDAMAIMEQFE